MGTLGTLREKWSTSQTNRRGSDNARVRPRRKRILLGGGETGLFISGDAPVFPDNVKRPCACDEERRREMETGTVNGAQTSGAATQALILVAG